MPQRNIKLSILISFNAIKTQCSDCNFSDIYLGIEYLNLFDKLQSHLASLGKTRCLKETIISILVQMSFFSHLNSQNLLGQIATSDYGKDLHVSYSHPE